MRIRDANTGRVAVSRRGSLRDDSPITIEVEDRGGGFVLKVVIEQADFLAAMMNGYNAPCKFTEDVEVAYSTEK